MPALQPPQPLSAMKTPKIGPTPRGPALNARIRASLNPSELRIPVCIANSIASQKHELESARAATADREAVRQCILRALAVVEKQRWSQRDLAGKLGLSWGTFRRIRDLEISPAAWLSKIESALARLNAA